jgi:hypothetical protein
VTCQLELRGACQWEKRHSSYADFCVPIGVNCQCAEAAARPNHVKVMHHTSLALCYRQGEKIAMPVSRYTQANFSLSNIVASNMLGFFFLARHPSPSLASPTLAGDEPHPRMSRIRVENLSTHAKRSIYITFRLNIICYYQQVYKTSRSSGESYPYDGSCLTWDDKSIKKS